MACKHCRHHQLRQRHHPGRVALPCPSAPPSLPHRPSQLRSPSSHKVACTKQAKIAQQRRPGQGHSDKMEGCETDLCSTCFDQ
eukprot:2100281-Rhodomonas_salina.1